MAAHGVQAAAAPAAPRSLRVVRLHIRGTKVDVPDAGPFDATFLFPTGVVMAVAPNLKGKTSLLEIITLCLRGSGRDLQSDVAAWLDAVECDIELNGAALAIRLKLEGGEIATGKVYQSGTIAELADAAESSQPIIDARGPEYSPAIEALMLDRLDLEPLHAVLAQVGLQEHGWPAYFGAIYPPAGGDRVLIGETSMAGLAGRLLSVFLDLPRAAVLTRIKTAVANLQASSDRRRAPASPRVDALLTAQQRVLQDATAALAALPIPSASSAGDAARRVADLSALLAEAERISRALVADHQRAKTDRQEDERALTSLREIQVAARLFHGLDPTICPRCESPVGADRKALEATHHTCAVCAMELREDDDEEARRELLEEKERALEATTAAEQQAQSALDQIEAEVTRLRAELEQAEGDLAAAVAARATGDRAELEATIARAEGALAALAEANEPLEPAEPDPTLQVLEALAIEFDREMHATSSDLLDELGKEIAVLAREFGIDAVTAARIDLGGHLRIEKGGSSGSFTSQSPGERLRLRIATVVALLRVGSRHGIATHPGLLMLDSLRAEEVQEADAHALLDALLGITERTPGLQIVTTTADGALPVGRLSRDHILEPDVPNGPLW